MNEGPCCCVRAMSCFSVDGTLAVKSCHSRAPTLYVNFLAVPILRFNWLIRLLDYHQFSPCMICLFMQMKRVM